MRYAGIRDCDIANGIGIRVSLFVQGCPHHCKGCFNEHTWNPEGGMLYTVDTEDKIINLLSQKHIAGLTLIGGEPLVEYNQLMLMNLTVRVKKKLPMKNIWCYTGYTFETIPYLENENITKTLLSNIDILVDGPFIESKKNIALDFRGSSNQRVIDLQKTLKSGEIVLYDRIKN